MQGEKLKTAAKGHQQTPATFAAATSTDPRAPFGLTQTPKLELLWVLKLNLVDFNCYAFQAISSLDSHI